MALLLSGQLLQLRLDGKRALQMPHGRYRTAAQGHLDNVRAVGALLLEVGEHVMRGGAGDLAALGRSDGVPRRAPGAGGAGLDFDKDKDALVEGDEVDLAMRTAVVAGQNLTAAGFQLRAGRRLASLADAQVERSARRARSRSLR